MKQKKTIKVISVFGTRPEAIKMAPLVKKLQACEQIESLVVVTAQHREMLDQVLQIFAIQPDYDLNLMKPGQKLEYITSGVLQGLSEIFAKEKPDLVLVHGDTTTTFSAALAAFYQQIPCGHVEAGLRTNNKYAPYPEEMNRRLTGALADYHFAPTVGARENLLRENISQDYIEVTGNTVIDALLHVVGQPCDLNQYGLGNIDWSKRVLLLTCHRRENWGEPMRQIFNAVADITKSYKDVEVIFPVHKNPLVRDLAKEILGNNPAIYLVEPLDYLPFSHVMQKCTLILTDSGGMQEEAPALGKPVLVLREVTERPEAIAAQTARLAGNTYQSVFDTTKLLLTDKTLYEQMAKANNPYGDGYASDYIVTAILHWML